MNRKMIQTVMALLILAGPFAGVSEARSRVVRWDASIQSPERGSTGHLGHAPVAPIQPKPQSKSQGEFAGKTKIGRAHV